ncbi:MAG TPA: PrsW family glutamic-type intramembrane protease [Xanthobacteraceae bacterium]|jgi:RsiW-degrading membrane proteinase PrsW (M82 family)|nr:PrsW family glutamic-type intramembrane protease [Xanthobacteraceae bacterium]
MAQNPNEFMPPIPRDQSGPSESEIIPFKSTKINIWKSKVLVPLLLVGIAVVAMFMMPATSGASFFAYFDVIAILGVVSIFLGIYFYSNESKPFFWYLVPALIAYLLLRYFFFIYVIVFRQILPGGDLAAGNTSFIANFISYFFGAGMCEEMLKATPILFAYFLARSIGPTPIGTAPTFGRLVSMNFTANDIKTALALRGPLDGLLMGFAAGAAFILLETLVQYVPNTVHKVTQASNSEAMGLLFGFRLLIPRVLQGVSGHMAWAAITGYFIGLAVRYPRQWIKLMLIGYLSAALLHGLWDSVGVLPFPPFWYAAVTVATILLFVSCLLKAKQLTLAWYGAPAVANDSILVNAPVEPAAPAPYVGGAGPAPGAAATAPATTGQALDGLMSTFRGVVGNIGNMVSAAANTVSAPPPAAPAPVVPRPAGDRYSIGTSTARFALEAGRSIDFASLFSAQGVPPGTTGEISHHPQNPEILGLQNTGTTAWTALTADGATATVPPGKNLRITAGTKLVFGSFVVDIQTY